MRLKWIWDLSQSASYKYSRWIFILPNIDSPQILLSHNESTFKGIYSLKNAYNDQVLSKGPIRVVHMFCPLHNFQSVPAHKVPYDF